MIVAAPTEDGDVPGHKHVVSHHLNTAAALSRLPEPDVLPDDVVDVGTPRVAHGKRVVVRRVCEHVVRHKKIG